MWVYQRNSTTLRMFTVAQRQANNGSIPARTLTSPALDGYRGQINFDSHGTLWVADYRSGLLGFSAAQLAAGGVAVEPSVILTDTTRGFAGASSIVFDASGNGWVAEIENENLVMYTPSMLATTGSPDPAVRIGATGFRGRVVRDGLSAQAIAMGNLPANNLSSPLAQAFDAHGNLWVAN